MIDSQPTTKETLGAPEITPLIDITFIVVVFLLLTANTPLLTLPINVPDADQETTLSEGSQQTLVVTISEQQPYWHIDKKEYHEWLNFKSALLLKIETNEEPLTIAADKAAPTEPLLQLLSLLNQQRFTDVKIIMNSPGDKL